jgi:hypothetical protein
MNTIKTLKRYAVYISLVVCSFAVWYLGTAFVLLEMNVVNWKQSERLLLVIEGAITSVGLIAIYEVDRRKF